MASAYDDERDRIEVPMPWDGLRNDLTDALQTMVVSHRPDHSASDRLHESTAYGTVKNPDREGANLVVRKELIGLTKSEIGRIRDIRLREMVEAHVRAEMAKGAKNLNEALASFSTSHRGNRHVKEGIRRVRILKREKPEYLVTIKHGNRHRKSYSAGENAFIDVFETPSGGWRGEATTVFDANRSDYRPRWRDTKDFSFVMRIRKGDLIAVNDDNGKRIVMVAHRLEASANRFRLAPHHETGDLQKRHENRDDPFRWRMWSYSALKERGAQRVRVDELGRVWRIPPEEAARSL